MKHSTARTLVFGPSHFAADGTALQTVMRSVIKPLLELQEVLKNEAVNLCVKGTPKFTKQPAIERKQQCLLDAVVQNTFLMIAIRYKGCGAWLNAFRKCTHHIWVEN